MSVTTDPTVRTAAMALLKALGQIKNSSEFYEVFRAAASTGCYYSGIQLDPEVDALDKALKAEAPGQDPTCREVAAAALTTDRSFSGEMFDEAVLVECPCCHDSLIPMFRPDAERLGLKPVP